MKTSYLITGALALSLVASNAAIAEGKNIGFAGIDLSSGSEFAYAGVIHSFNGTGSDGLAAKVFLGGGSFSYDTASAGFGAYPGGNVDGRSKTADLMIGYRKHAGQMQFGAYVGVNYWEFDQDLITGPFGGGTTDADAVGTETALKLELEASGMAAGIAIDARGSYSGAFDTHWARLRGGKQFSNLTFGLELTNLGNVDYDQKRYGLYAQFGPIDISVGRANSDGSSSDGTYGTLGFSKTF